jgi:hypothetical protein
MPQLAAVTALMGLVAVFAIVLAIGLIVIFG